MAYEILNQVETILEQIIYQYDFNGDIDGSEVINNKIITTTVKYDFMDDTIDITHFNATPNDIIAGVENMEMTQKIRLGI